MKIAVITAIQSGIDTLEMIRNRVNIDLVIGLDGQQVRDKVAGYVDVAEYCEHVGYRYMGVSSYSLKSELDREKLLEEEIDVLLVLGWQRLIPDWFIQHVKIAVLGGHGSADGITAGRGRSPQNWALILGKLSFSIALFKINAGVDSGPVLMERSFNYSVLDDIETSYYKTSWLMSEMIVELLNSNDPSRFAGIPQTGEPTYLPKRTAEDGVIDWQQSSNQIFNFVRALTRPYPGAFTLAKEAHVAIWQATPFELPIEASRFQPGEICQTLLNGSFVVRSGDGFVLVREWSASVEWQPCNGSVFSSVSVTETIRQIIDRHQRETKGCPLNADILKWSA
jgi:methionyl-tRNA formyltransferase